jgi:hypothetical protein
MFRRSSTAASALLLILFSPFLRAQIPTSEITGTVTDPSGAVVTGALITLANPATNTQRTVRTNTAGIYDLPALLPGNYNLKIEMAGFNAQVRNDIGLQVAQVARIDISLQLGNATQVVEVTGGAPVLETESTSVGTVIENQRIVELPLNGRNYLQLAALTPAATTNSPPSSVMSLRQGGTRSLFTLSVGGQRIFLNHYTLDGIENTDPNWNSYILLPSLDALQEFKVETGIFPAEYGHNMSQINVTTKSGSNRLHGSAFEFLRNSDLDAKNYFDVKTQPIPPFKRNQFGATLGGPVEIPHLVHGKDKLFFFFDYEGLRERKALTQGATLPPASWIAGDFSGVSTMIYDPTTRIINPAGTAVTSATPFPDNKIPSNRIAPISSQYFAKFIPVINAPANALANDFINNEGRPTDTNQETSRFDYAQSVNSNWMFRYSHSGESQYNPINIPNEGNNVFDQAHQGVLGFTRVFGATKVNDFRAGVSRFENSNVPRRAGVDNVVAGLGITGLDTSNPLYWGVPNITLGGGFSATGELSDSPFINYDTIIQFADTFSWTHGKHSLKFGGEFSRTRFNQLGGVVTRGRFTENGQYTTNGTGGTAPANNIADFMLGYFSNVESQTGEPLANFRNKYFGLYLEDSWKVTSKLTINYGLRWEYQSPWVDKFDHIVNIDFRWDSSIFPTYVRAGTGDPLEGNPPDPLPSSIPYVRDGRFGDGNQKPDYHNFGPRLGVAWSPNSKTVIRAGAGIFYVHDVGNANFDVVRNAPFSIRNSEAANTLIPNLFWGHLFSAPSNIPSFILINQYNEPTAHVGQWSFGVQREIWSNSSIEANYVGSVGAHLPRLLNYNTAPPGPGNINPRRPFPIFNGAFQVMGQPVHSSYDALQMRFQQRFSRGFTLLSSFSWGKSIDNSSGPRQQGGDVQSPSNDYNLSAERGLSAFDFRRRWTNSLLYALPIGKGKALLGNAGRSVDALLGGWQLGTILTLQDGFPLTATCGSGSVQNGGDTCYPDATGINPNLPMGSQGPNQWFNLAAFLNRAPGGAQYRFGNSGRNTIIGPGIIDIDFSVIKNFRFTERQGLEFRAEFFNLPNHPLWGLPGASPGTSTYGVITSTVVDSRQLQLALKYSF